ncbi:hypothetical protein [Actinoplanes sp. NPDC051494]|uniref:hypothetical protein n=1 Tax=Actinoplanes sp. NPDC051494 TaxID=3363907 RepID=UPI0037A9C0FF
MAHSERQDDDHATESTRLLCAAAYLDSKFADSVVQQLRDETRAVAPHYGVDLVPVVRHCLASAGRRTRRDIVLSLLLGAAIVAAWSGMPLLAAAGRLLALAWAVVLVLACLDRFQVLPQFHRDRFAASSAPEPSASDARRLGEMSRLAQGNVTVYSDFSPFAGSGVKGESWSFITDLSQGTPAPEGTRIPETFTVEALYRSVTAEILDLRIPALTVENRLFVNGTDARDQRWLFPRNCSRPETQVPSDRLAGFMGAPTHQVRHYLAVRVADWRGEMVVTLFVRFVISGDHLFSEAAYCVVPPLRDSFRTVDRMVSWPGFRSSLTVIMESLVATVPNLVLAPGRVARLIASNSLPESTGSHTSADYGAPPSIREQGMAGAFRHYFQRVDHDMHTKLIERRVLEALNAFLERHHIDTRSTRQQQVTIINSGVMMSGGTVNAESVAVGAGARTVRTVRSFIKENQKEKA